MLVILDDATTVKCTEFCQKLCSIGALDGKLPSHDDLANTLNIGGSGYQLGTLYELRGRRNCPFCQLVLTACEEKLVGLKDGEQDLDTLPAQPIRVITFPGENCFRLTYPAPIGTRLMFVADSVDGIEPEKGPFVARAVKGQQISPSLVRSWLQQCEDAHGNTCFHIPRNLKDIKRGNLDIHEERSSNFRLVDLEMKCVRSMPLDTQYVTLSYVWGQAATFQLRQGNLELLQTPGSLDSIMSDFPQTIVDAIEFVRSLGERYLWVDTLCLIQDHQRDVKAGVQIMNSIYQGSYFTIVAGSGVDAQAGLPGVRPGSRQPSQPISQLNPNMRMAIVHSIDWHLQNTMYNQRGWTFQELILPRRTVVFVNDQVYFRCVKANWCEETAADLLSNWTDPDDSNIVRLPEPGAHCMEAWWAYQKLCENYSTRTLRYDGDAVRAFSGVLRPLGASLTSWLTEGIPAYYLDVALLFVSSNGALRRRPGFASYSWAGWSGRITWPRELHHWPGNSRQSPKNLFRWIQEKTFIQWRIWPRRGSLSDAECIDEYNYPPDHHAPSRVKLLTDRYAHWLTQDTIDSLNARQTESRLPFALGGGGSSGFPRPNFQRGQQYDEDIQPGDLYQLELVNSQAELDKLNSEIDDPLWILMLANWRCHRELKTRRCKGKGLEDPTTMSRDEDEFDFEFRDGPSTQVQSVSGEEGFRAPDDRIERAQDAIKLMKELGVEPIPEIPNFPRYHLIYFQTISIRLITGPPPPLESKPDPIEAALPPHNYPFQRVKGSPLFSPEGELVGSLHLDDVSSHKAGIEVECLIMASSFQPMEGSALPSPKEAVKEEDDWSLFWILYVVEIEGIYERRGVGQVLDSALVKACAPAEAKAILLG